MAHLLISAAHKSSGKTTVSIGLCSALAARGMTVQPFKKGPDYIDPLWLSQAAGRACYNLDFYLSRPDEIRACFAQNMRDAQIGVIEGNKGLYDGLDLDGSNSNAALASLLDAPVVLVIDARGMTRGIAPLLLGYQAFDRNIRIAGVILNNLGGRRHESKLRAVIEHYTDVRVLGAIQHDARLEITERHLGLVPSNEAAGASHRIAMIAERVAGQVDLERIVEVAQSAGQLEYRPVTPSSQTRKEGAPIRLGIARDAAFAFYYAGDLQALEAAGAELIAIDTLHDQRLPAVDGLFLGGGFPETHMAGLEANRALRSEIRTAIERGLPVYAECGGLMYLARSLSWQGRRAEMVGALPIDIVMHDRPVGRGYVRLRETGKGPWALRDAAGSLGEIKAHEFHYSSAENVPPDLCFAYEVLRGHGLDGQHDGIVHKNVLASYTHLRDVAENAWAERFVNFIRVQRSADTKRVARSGH